MYVVHVFARVLPGSLDAFREATVANARASLVEPGVARFDVVQQHDDPTRFVLVEAYRSPADAEAHKRTPHYAAWRDRVAGMMAEPRHNLKFDSIFPADGEWSTRSK